MFDRDARDEDIVYVFLCEKDGNEDKIMEYYFKVVPDR